MITEDDLKHFTGSETFYRHSLNRKILYTEGVQYLAEQAGAYWFIDLIASMQLDPKVAAEEFQSWKLTVGDNHTGMVTCDDGNGNWVYEKRLDFTDFPLKEITLWFTNNTILLPSEY